MSHPIGAGWGAMHSARRRDELAGRKVGRETALRVLRFARPFYAVIAASWSS